MHDDLTPAEQALLAEHAQREHEERMADPEFRKGWDRMSSLLAAEAEVKQLRADLVTVSKEAADLEGLAVDLGVKLKETEAERDAIEAARCPSCDHLPTGHQEDGCWYAVTTGTPGRDLVCPCTLPVAALDGQARTTTDNRRDAVSAVIKPIIICRNDAITRAGWEAARPPQHPSGPAWCAICDEPSPCQKARSDLRAALDDPTEETPDPGAYIYITYGPWDSSGHQCGDLTPGGCDEPVPFRPVIVHSFNSKQVIGHELGDCPNRCRTADPTETTGETP